MFHRFDQVGCLFCTISNSAVFFLKRGTVTQVWPDLCQTVTNTSFPIFSSFPNKSLIVEFAFFTTLTHETISLHYRLQPANLFSGYSLQINVDMKLVLLYFLLLFTSSYIKPHLLLFCASSFQSPLQISWYFHHPKQFDAICRLVRHLIAHFQLQTVCEQTALVLVQILVGPHFHWGNCSFTPTLCFLCFTSC